MSKVDAVLYSSWRSSCSYRVRICLNLKNIKFELKPVDSSRLASSAGVVTYTQNPMNYVPAIDINGKTLIESMAIMEYLEEVFPEKPLMPKDSFNRAQVRAICGIIVAGIQPLQNTSVLNKIGDLTNKEEEEKWSQHWITKGFKAIEKFLESSAGKYCVGDEITLADCCLIPQVYNARRSACMNFSKTFKLNSIIL